jgi:hypothetical protein
MHLSLTTSDDFHDIGVVAPTSQDRFGSNADGTVSQLPELRKTRLPPSA